MSLGADLSSPPFRDLDPVDGKILLGSESPDGESLVVLDLETGDQVRLPPPPIAPGEIRLSTAELSPDARSVVAFAVPADRPRSGPRRALAIASTDPDTTAAEVWAVVATWPEEEIVLYDGEDSLRWVTDDTLLGITDGSALPVEVTLER